MRGRSTGRRWFDSRPTGIVLRLYRLPVLLYRLDLGWLLGHRGLLLTHRGRKTGLLRQTVLEVIVYDPAARKSVVLSGYGERADWYRNITTEPALEVQTGRERYVPAQRFLAPEETLAAIAEYERRHPLERFGNRVVLCKDVGHGHLLVETFCILLHPSASPSPRSNAGLG